MRRRTISELTPGVGCVRILKLLAAIILRVVKSIVINVLIALVCNDILSSEEVIKLGKIDHYLYKDDTLISNINSTLSPQVMLVSHHQVL